MEKVTVIGHKNQDTDSTCAALALAEVLTKAKIFDAKAKIPDALNRETEYVLNRFKVKKPCKFKLKKGEKLFLVDFNEEEQSPAPFKDVSIEGLVDHHKLKLCFDKDYPIIFRVEPIGSSSSIVAKMFFDHEVALSKQTAGLILSGIVSDTLNFSSPTTTLEDIALGKKLAKLAGVKIKELAEAMFEAKSNLKGISPKKLITTDYKEFRFSKYKTGIGVIETVNPAAALAMEQALRKALSEYKKAQKVNLIFLGLVDILNNNTDLILIGQEEEDAARKVFKGARVNDGIMHLKGVVSRKKQIVPEFTSKLK